MSLTYSDRSQLKTSQDLYYLDVALSDEHGNSKTIRVADHVVEIGTSSSANQYDGLVLEWDTVVTGSGEPWKDSYSMPTIRVRLAVDREGDQSLGHNLIDVLTAYDFHGATVTLYHRFGETNLTASPLYQQRFSGRIFHIPAGGITREFIEFQARGEFHSEITPIDILRRGQYSNMVEDRGDVAVPLIEGPVGFDYLRFTGDKSNTTGVESSDWRLFCLSKFATPMELQNRDTLVAQVSSVQISTDALNGSTAPCVIWEDDREAPGIFEDLAAGDYSEANGTITIPTLAGSDYGGAANDDDVAVRKFDMPRADNSDDVSASSLNWTDWQNAFSRDLTTYAEIVNDASTLNTAGSQNFIRRPPGAYVSSAMPDLTEGASHYVIALIYTSGGYDIKLAIVGTNGTEWSTTYTAGTQLAAGYHIIKHELTDSAVDATLRDSQGTLGDWGNGSGSANEGIYIQQISPSSGDTLRVYMFGVSYVDLIPYRSLSYRTKRNGGRSGDLSGGWVDPPQMFYVGHGSEQGGSALTHPADALQRILIEGTANDDSPITTGDIDTSTSGVGSFTVFETEFDTNVIGSSAVAQCAIIEQRPDVTLMDILASYQEAFYCSVWRSSIDGLWKVRLRRGSPTADGRVLYAHNLVGAGDGLRIGYMPQPNIVNACYLDFDLDPVSGVYQQSQWIDNSTIQSQKYDGTRDTGSEVWADGSQATYGRKEKRIRTSYVADSLTAWSALGRRFETLYKPRLVMRVVCDREFADDLEPNEVFTTSTSMDDLMRIPLKADPSSPYGQEYEPSWNNQKWWTTRITEQPYGGFIVEAVWMGDFE